MKKHLSSFISVMMTTLMFFVCGGEKVCAQITELEVDGEISDSLFLSNSRSVIFPVNRTEISAEYRRYLMREVVPDLKMLSNHGACYDPFRPPSDYISGTTAHFRAARARTLTYVAELKIRSPYKSGCILERHIELERRGRIKTSQNELPSNPEDGTRHG